MARPKAQIDWNDVGEMLKCGCNTTSIATTLGISPDTLYTRSKIDNKLDFSAFSQQKRAKGAYLLRQKQFEIAMSGNIPMLIWLGKNRLGQSDKQEVKTQKLPVSESQKGEKLLSMIDHYRRVHQVYDLEPLGVTFDPENSERLTGLKDLIRGASEAHKQLYPDQCEIFDNWEERFERFKNSNSTFGAC